MANPRVSDYLFWPLDPVRILRNLMRAACLDGNARNRPSLALAAIEEGLAEYREGLEAADYDFAPGDQPSPASAILTRLSQRGLLDEKTVEALAGIAVANPLFHALTRNCERCGQRNFVAADACWHCDAPLPEAPDLAQWESTGAYMLAPHDLYIEKRLRERSGQRSAGYGRELRSYADDFDAISAAASHGKETRISDKTQELQTRYAVVLGADVAGFSGLSAEDEAAARRSLDACRREVLEPAMGKRGGRIFKTIGDGILMEFATPADAVDCAVEIQSAMRTRVFGTSEKALSFRMGIDAGETIVDGEDLYGDTVNGAARLTSLAPAGGLCASDAIIAQVGGSVPLEFEDCGEQSMPFGAKPLRVHRAVL